MVVIVTLNPSIDYFIEISEYTEGKSISSTGGRFNAGGKGLNVSRVLSHLGTPCKSLAFVGGFTGQFILSETQEFLIPIPIEGLNRINTKIKTSRFETEIHGFAPKITASEFKTLYHKLEELSPQIDILILSGSIPNSLEADAYKILSRACKNTAKIIIDTRGQALKESLSLDSIFLVKPNRDEIGELFGCDVYSLSQALELAQKMKMLYPIEHLIVSLGSAGAYFLVEDSIYFAEPLTGILVNSVGAGDSVVAGFSAKYLETQNSLEAFAYGIACGAGTAFSQGLCDKQAADQLYAKVSLKQIK